MIGRGDMDDIFLVLKLSILFLVVVAGIFGFVLGRVF